MNKFTSPENRYWRNLLTRSTLVVVSVVIIVWFLPRNSGPQFRYDVGKPWMYGSLIANFDFPIYKTDESIKAEQDSLLSLFEPYYNYKVEVEKNQLARFYEKYKEGIPGLSKDYVTTIIDRLHRLYQAGIMNQLRQGSQREISHQYADQLHLLHHGGLRAAVPRREVRSTTADPPEMQSERISRTEPRL